MKQYLISLFLLIAVAYHLIDGFNFASRHAFKNYRGSINRLKMEYIPDGLTKAQWEEIKRKEAEEEKKRKYGAMGVTKFKSRAFEAWQKSGAGHLFPVSSDTPLEARPYMQRVGGSADGEDLKKKGINPKGQATPSAKNEADLKYEQLEKDGKLWGFNLPWTAEAASNLNKSKKFAKIDSKGNTKSTTTPKKGTTAVPTTPSEEEPKKKKGLFGLF